MAGDKMNDAQRAEARRIFSAKLSDLRDPIDVPRVGIRNAVDYTDDWYAESMTSTGTENAQYRENLPAPFKVGSNIFQKDLMMLTVIEERIKNGVR